MSRPALALSLYEQFSAVPQHRVAFELAPDWVCEVISPSTEAVDRTDKLPIYAAAGVAHTWLVNPLAQTLEVLKLELGRWLLFGTYRAAARVRAEPFDAIELELGALWAR